MGRYVALLRAVNVGGRKVPMADLRATLGRLGYADVATYVQSGNVVLTAPGSAADVAREMEKAIKTDFGLEVPVVVRSRDELADVIARDPFGDAVTDPARYQVVFFPEAPPADALDGVDLASFAPEEVRLLGRELYAWTPGGIGRSPLLIALGKRKVDATGTARNWRTVTKLLDLADS